MVSRYKFQNGAALLMAMVAVALIALIAMGIATAQSLQIKKVQNSLHYSNSMQYLLAAEQLTAQALQQDLLTEAKRNAAYDFDEPYLSQKFMLPLDNGMISAEIEDLQGKFNLRNLSQENGGQDLRATPAFDRLLRQLKIDSSITDAIIDWIDEDDDAMPQGAEDSYYLSQQRQKLTANQALASIEELREIKGFEKKISDANGKQQTVYQLLQQHVVLLDRRSILNVNTASVELMQSYFPHLTANKLEQIMRDRPFKTADEFKSHQAHKLEKGEIKFELLPEFSTRSNYFLLKSVVSLGSATSAMHSILRRDVQRTTIQVISRKRSFI